MQLRSKFTIQLLIQYHVNATEDTVLLPRVLRCALANRATQSRLGTGVCDPAGGPGRLEFKAKQDANKRTEGWINGRGLEVTTASDSECDRLQSFSCNL